MKQKTLISMNFSSLAAPEVSFGAGSDKIPYNYDIVDYAQIALKSQIRHFEREKCCKLIIGTPRL